MNEIGKLDYSHFGKFLASLGVLLIGISILLPWLFLQTSFNTLINVADLSNLTPTAQLLIKNQQETALWLLQNIYVISGSLVALGLILLSWGLYIWIRYQVRLDALIQKKTQMEINVMENQIKSMSQDEVIAEKQQEAKFDIEVERIAEADPNRIEEALADAEQPAITSVANEYLRVEDAVITRLSECLPGKKMLPRHKVNRTRYDVIIRSSASNEPDVLIEIKALRSVRHDTVRISEAMYDLNARLHIYKEAMNTQVRTVLLFVFVSERTPARVDRDNKGVAVMRAKLGLDVQVRFLDYNEISRLPCEEISALVYPKA